MLWFAAALLVSRRSKRQRAADEFIRKKDLSHCLSDSLMALAFSISVRNSAR